MATHSTTLLVVFIIACTVDGLSPHYDKCYTWDELTNKPDYITQDYFTKHICVWKDTTDKPSNEDFCKNFRNEKTLYSVITTDSEDTVAHLNNDIKQHQNVYDNDKAKIAVSGIHFYSDSTYDWIDCWLGLQKYVTLMNYYSQYNLATKKQGGKWVLNHGCAPVNVKPGFSEDGKCSNPVPPKSFSKEL